MQEETRANRYLVPAMSPMRASSKLSVANLLATSSA